MRALPAVIVIALLVIATIIVVEHPGTVEILWHGYRIETAVSVLVLGTVALAFLAAAVFHLLRKLLRSPSAILRSRRERRRREGYRALTQGMVAIAAGDAEEAQKLARKADVLLAEPPLTLLLSAQAAQLAGDEQAARNYFTAMLDRPDTEFLGLRGLIMQALRAGDEAKALELVERARALRPKAPWVTSSHFELLARAGKWHEAEQSLGEALKRKLLPAEPGRRQRAAVLHERSRLAESEGAQSAALSHAAKAHEADPGFAPAALRYAELLRVGGRERKAAKVIEAAWRVAPNPALAQAYGALYVDVGPLAKVKQMERLAAVNPDHPESHLAIAEAALQASLWGEARRHLDAVLGPGEGEHRSASPRVARLMAALEEAQHGDQPAARAWLARAAAAETSDPTYVCEACGAESAEWSAHCPSCRSFATLHWRAPGVRLAPRLAAHSGLLPPLPLPARWPGERAPPG